MWLRRQAHRGAATGPAREARIQAAAGTRGAASAEARCWETGQRVSTWQESKMGAGGQGAVQRRCGLSCSLLRSRVCTGRGRGASSRSFRLPGPSSRCASSRWVGWARCDSALILSLHMVAWLEDSEFMNVSSFQQLGRECRCRRSCSFPVKICEGSP